MKDAWVIYSKYIYKKKKRMITLAKEKYNLDIDVLCAHDFKVISDGKENKLYYKSEEVKEVPKIVLLRKCDIYLTRQFEYMGSYVINSCEATSNARNKMRTYQILTNNNIRIPKTIYIVCGVKNKYFTYDEIKEYFGSSKFIMKSTTGSKGNEVYLIQNENDLKNSLSKCSDIPIFQEYIETSFGKDIRAYVIGGKFIGCAIRQSDGENFRSNLAQGGSALKFEANDEIKDIALRTAKALKLDICGVDILFAKDGYMVCEANSIPGFESVRTTMNISDEDLLLTLIKSKVEGE